MFFERCEVVSRLIDRRPESVHTIQLEQMISSPHEKLAALCDFCGLDADPEFIDKCASRVYTKPNLSRGNIEWPSLALASIQRQAEAYSFLDCYQLDAAAARSDAGGSDVRKSA